MVQANQLQNIVNMKQNFFKFTYNNRRNNMSIVSADYIMVDNCKFYDANGTAPEYGIDIETNNKKVLKNY